MLSCIFDVGYILYDSVDTCAGYAQYSFVFRATGAYTDVVLVFVGAVDRAYSWVEDTQHGIRYGDVQAREACMVITYTSNIVVGCRI